MPRRRTLFWAIAGSVVAAVALVIALVEVIPDRPPRATASSVASHSPAKRVTPAPVVTPRSTSSFSYLSDETPDIKLSELIYPGAVKLAGSIYPQSISFYCYDGDPPAFPVYQLRRNDRRFEATVGMEAMWRPASYLTGVSVLGDGRTLASFSVSVLKPKTIDINVTGIRTLELECFSPGITSAASAADVEVGWGNARVTERP